MMIFITGANGLIGSFICRRLLADGHQLRALRRAGSDLSLLDDLHDQIDWVEGDILDVVSLEQHTQGADAVVHCAALVSYDSRDEQRMHKANVEGTANVVNICLDQSIAHLLHVSSVAAIGREKNATQVDESHQANPNEFTTAYARSKYLAEMEVWRGTSEGLSTVIINPSLVLGPGDWNQSSTKIFKYIWDESRFYTNGTVNYVDVRDVATVALRLLKQQVTGQRFIVSAGSTTYQNLFEMIAQSFDKQPPRQRASPGLIRVASVLDGWRARLTGQPQMITDELRQVSRHKHTFDNSKVRQAIDINFNPLPQTIRWCCHELTKKTQKVQS